MNKFSLMSICTLIGLSLGYVINEVIQPALSGGSSHQPKEESQSSNQEKLNSSYWTCSMHPDVKQSDPGQCPICGMDLTLHKMDILESHPEAHAITTIQMSPQQQALAQVQISEVKLSEQALELEIYGRVERDSSQLRSLALDYSGRVERSYLKFPGQKVQAGQKLFDVYSPEIIGIMQEYQQLNLTGQAGQTSQTSQTSQIGMMESLRKKIRNMGLREKDLQSMIENKSNLYPVRAPMSGELSGRWTPRGEYFQIGESLLSISSHQNYWAEFEVPLHWLNYIQVGQKIKLTGYAEIKVDHIDPEINPQTQQVSLRSRLKSNSKMMLSSQFLEGRIVLEHGSLHDSSSDSLPVLIPSSAVLYTGEQSLVYVEVNIGEYEAREVNLGLSSQGLTQVTSGLTLGEKVVTRGAFQVDATSQLQGKTSMMNSSARGQ